MATYYASKSYVTRLTVAIYEELRRKKSNVHVSCLCPGPVKTNFNNVANVKFAIDGLESRFVARYAIEKTLKGKLTIIPGKSLKLGIFSLRFLPEKLMLKMSSNIQSKKS